MERASVALDRIAHRRAARSLILYGLRGVGKTVLLQRIATQAEADGMTTVVIESPESRSLPSILGPTLRAGLIKMSRTVAAKAAAKRAWGALAGFIKAAKLKYEDIEFNIDLDGEAGLADSGDLESDLTDLIVCVGETALAHKTALVLVIDELQYIPEPQLAALITALHRANQKQLPVTLIAAGLPQLLGQMGRAKSYAERLFEFVRVGPLDATAATRALCIPAQQEGARFTDEAISEILDRTQGYPYFIQEWGKHAWAEASQSPITLSDARRATEVALAELDASFFRVRFDRLTPAEKRYMRAMAELGPRPTSLGRHRSDAGQEHQHRGPGAGQADRKRHGLQPLAR